jgi:hypothetical protein
MRKDVAPSDFAQQEAFSSLIQKNDKLSDKPQIHSMNTDSLSKRINKMFGTIEQLQSGTLNQQWQRAAQPSVSERVDAVITLTSEEEQEELLNLYWP